MQTKTLGILIVSSTLALSTMGPYAAHAQTLDLAKNTLSQSAKIVQLTPDATFTSDPAPAPDSGASSTPTPAPEPTSTTTPAVTPAPDATPVFTNPDPIAAPANVTSTASEPTPAPVLEPVQNPEPTPAGIGMNIKTKPTSKKPITSPATTTSTSSTPFGGTLAGNINSPQNVYESSYHFSSGMTRTLLELALVLGASGLVLAQKRSVRTVLTSVWD